MLDVVAQLLPLLALQDHLPPHILLFVDNEPARHALSKGFGRDHSLNKLLQVAWCFMERRAWWPVWQRVCSEANVSDAVSRFDFRYAEQHGWQWAEHDYESLLETLLRALEWFPEKGL